MKLEIDRTELVNALALANKAIAGKTTRPILQSVYMKAANDKLQLVGTDGDQMMIVELSASVDKDGIVAVPAKLMLELCSALPSNSLFPMALEFAPDDYKLTISLDKSKYEINTTDPGDYPPVPDFSDLQAAKIQGSILALAVKQAMIAADQADGVNPVQKAVYLDLTEAPTAVATDSKRLTVVNLSDFEAPANMKQGFIIPIKAIKELSEMLKHADEADFALFKGQLVCRVEGATYMTRTLEGSFPAYQRVLPKASNSAVIVNRKALSQALKTLAPIAKNNSNAVLFEFANESLQLSASSAENGNAQTNIDCKVSGEAPAIKLNLQFVADFLGSVDSDDIKMELTTATYPVLFSANDGEQRYIVMPLSM